MNNLTPAQAEAYARAKTSVVDLFSFELTHSTFPQPIRMINYDSDLSLTIDDELVEFMGVAFPAPDEEIDTEPGNTITVTVAGISSQALPYLNIANDTLEPIAAIVRFVAFDTKVSQVIGISRASQMQVRNFATDVLSVQMTLGFTNLNTRVLDV